MAAKSRTRIPREIMQEASDWFVEFRVEDAEAGARDRFDRWLRQSPLHIQAYLEIATTYAALPTRGAGVVFNVDELIGRARASLDADVVSLGSLPSKPRARNPGGYRVLLAASLAALTVAAAVLGWSAWRNRGIYSTAIGEERSITLADGTTVDLNARSRIRVHFTAHQRTVDLLEGQALFDDVKLPSDPFVVRSRGVVIRAIGTQFDVNREVTGTTVTVLDGAVAVHPGSVAYRDGNGHGNGQRPALPAGIPSAAMDTRIAAAATPPRPSKAILVSAGEQLTIGGGASLSPHPADLDAAIAWRRHELIFDSSKLVDVVEQFNRYNSRQLVIESPALQDYEISGVYSSTDPTSFIRFLQAQPGFIVTRSAGSIRITQR